MSLIVDSIFTEWRASLPEGSVCPNTKNGYHLFLLKEICLKRGIPENVINNVLLMLEKEETYKLRKKDSGEISVFTNKDNYEKALDSGDYEEPEGGEEEPQTKKPEINPLFQKDGKPDDNLIKTGSSEKTTDDEESEEEKKAKSKAKVEAISKKLYGEDGEGSLLQNSRTSQEALDRGYKAGKYWVAPGNAGSNFNENMSNEGALILEEQEDLTEEELARVIYNRTKDTNLGKQQKKTQVQSPHNKDTVKVPGDIENSDLYKASVLTARAAREKHNRAKRGQKAVGMKNAKIKTFGGTDRKAGKKGKDQNTPDVVKADLEALKDEVRKAKKIYIFDEEIGKVVEIPQQVMLDWIDSSGGGENAGDTAVISVDDNGNLLYDGWSDKKNFSDIQGNSTLNDDYTKQDRYVDDMLANERIDESTAKQAKDIIDDAKKRSDSIEENYKKAPLKVAQFLAKYQGGERTRVVQHLKDQAKKYDRDGTTNHITDPKKGLMQRYGVDNYDDLLDAIINECENGKPSGTVLKVMDRVGDSERGHLKERDGEIPAGIDTKVILSNAREEALNLQRDTVDKLNDLKGKSKNGKEKRLGDVLGFQETIDFLHLDKIEEPKDENDYKAYLKRNTHLCMAGVNVPPKSIKECMGVNNLSEAEDNFEVVTDERIMRDQATGTYVTGKTVYIYAINKDNERVFIGEKVFRSREGATGKTNNEIKWSKEMQKCFDSKRDK